MKDDLELANRLIAQAREEWLEANDPQDGPDVVTPYDVWFYKVRLRAGQPMCNTALVGLVERAQELLDPCYPREHLIWQKDAKAALSQPAAPQPATSGRQEGNTQ